MRLSRQLSTALGEAKAKPFSLPPAKPSRDWIERHARAISKAVAEGLAKLIDSVARDKQITYDVFQYWTVKRVLEKELPKHVEKVLSSGDHIDIRDYDGMSGEFDREVIAPGLEKIFGSIRKHSGFGPRSITMRLRKMEHLPGDRETIIASKELLNMRKAERAKQGEG